MWLHIIPEIRGRDPKIETVLGVGAWDKIWTDGWGHLGGHERRHDD